jgi:hypothetical protein
MRRKSKAAKKISFELKAKIKAAVRHPEGEEIHMTDRSFIVDKHGSYRKLIQVSPSLRRLRQRQRKALEATQ